MKNRGLLTGIVIAAVLLIVGGIIYALNTNNNSNHNSMSTQSSNGSKDNMGMNKQSPANSDTTTSTPATTNSVTIQNYAFSPAAITVKKGTKVTWTNQDAVSHTITADSGTGPNSALFAKGETYSYTFDTVGTFNYHCTPHPYMKGSVVVTD